MSIAMTVYEFCKDKQQSLYELAHPDYSAEFPNTIGNVIIENDYSLGETTYIFEDGSAIKDDSGYLYIEK